MRLFELKKCLVAILEENSDVENAPREFSIIVEDSIGLSKLDQIIKPNFIIDDEMCKIIEEKVERRKSHTPLSYITGKREFYGLSFKVSRDTLIPRPDTETIVEEAISEIKKIKNANVLDLCTGTGAIGIAIKANCNCTITLSDISEKTLEITKQNAKELINSDCKIICSNLFDKIDDKFDLIATNPPYLTENWYQEVSDEVKREPKLALVSSGDDGLDLIREIISKAPKYLKNGGILLIECDYRQTSLCAKLLETGNFKNIKIIKDLAQKERVVRGSYYA